MARQQKQTNSGETVTVACKLPHGLVLRVFDMVPTPEPLLGGGVRESLIAQELGERYTVQGNSHAQNMAPNAPITGGYALTFGIPKAFWDRWLRENKDSDVVKNHLIFANEKSEHVQDEAEDKKDIKSGLERLNPNKLPKGLEKFDKKEA